MSAPNIPPSPNLPNLALIVTPLLDENIIPVDSSPASQADPSQQPSDSPEAHFQLPPMLDENARPILNKQSETCVVDEPCSSAPVKPRIHLEALRVTTFSGQALDYPKWRQEFEILVGSQGFPDQVTLIYLREALPDDLLPILAGVPSMTIAWERLDHRFGDKDQRLLLLYERLAGFTPQGDKHDVEERLHIELEDTISSAIADDTSHILERDIHLVPILLAKLHPDSMEKWIERWKDNT